MPRPGPRRENVPLKLRPLAIVKVTAMAEKETKGNVSEMLRKLIAEAMAARVGKDCLPAGEEP